MKKVKEIFKRENRDRAIPLLLLLFAVGVQGTLLYMYSMCGCGPLTHIGDIPNEFIVLKWLILTLVLTFPITLCAGSWLYLKHNGFKRETIASLSLLLLVVNFPVLFLIHELITPIILLIFIPGLIIKLFQVNKLDENNISRTKQVLIIASFIILIVLYCLVYIDSVAYQMTL